MKKNLAKKITVFLSAILLVTSVFPTGVSFADEVDGSQQEEIVQEKAQEDNGAQVVDEEEEPAEESTQEKKPTKVASLARALPKIKLSFEPVDRAVYKNKSGVFEVVFRGAWEDDSLLDGETFEYKLYEGSKEIASGTGFDPNKKVKIRKGGGSYKLSVTAFIGDQEAWVVESNTIDSFEFPAKPTGLKVTTKKSTNDANLVWKKVEGASYYYVYRSTKKTAPAKPIKKVSGTSFKNKNLAGKTYYYWVQAIMDNDEYTTASSLSAKDSVKIAKYLTAAVRPYHWYARAKKTTKLYKKRKGGASLGKLKKGTKVRLTLTSPKRLKYGQKPKRVLVEYKQNGKTKKGWVKYRGVFNKVKAQVAYINKRAYDWTRSTKEAWVNKKAFKSKTKYFIWVSTYSQRVNIFKKKNGKWSLVKHFRTTTGSYLYPTRSGSTYKVFKRKGRRVRKFTHSSKHYYYTHLSFFRGGDAFHTISWMLESKSHKVVKKVRKTLKPDTRGCCRLTVPNAKWIYRHVPLKTKVVVY